MKGAANQIPTDSMESMPGSHRLNVGCVSLLQTEQTEQYDRFWVADLCSMPVLAQWTYQTPASLGSRSPRPARTGAAAAVQLACRPPASAANPQGCALAWLPSCLKWPLDSAQQLVVQPLPAKAMHGSSIFKHFQGPAVIITHWSSRDLRCPNSLAQICRQQNLVS